MSLLVSRSGNHQVTVIYFGVGCNKVRQCLLRKLSQLKGLLSHVATGEHRVDRIGGSGLNASDHLLNFLSGLSGAVGQRANFVSNHRETTTSITRTSSFDGSVQR